MVSNMKRNILIISLSILVSVSSVALLVLNNAHIDRSNDEALEIGGRKLLPEISGEICKILYH